jgi:hypothetical protein
MNHANLARIQGVRMFGVALNKRIERTENRDKQTALPRKLQNLR